jgi:DNA-binding transcriptional regulator LsrR (DeoR family)
MVLNLQQKSNRLKAEADERLRLVAAAYESGIRQADIARSMGLSRQLVHKLIVRARDRGILKR